MGLNFYQNRQLNTEYTAVDNLKEQCLDFVSIAIDHILNKLADKEDMNYILNEFECRPHWTTDNTVSCP